MRSTRSLRRVIHTGIPCPAARFSVALKNAPAVSGNCVHRTGELAIGDLAVWVGVSAAHRDAAFAACRFVIDEVKARVPIWKRERYADGDRQWLHPEQAAEPGGPGQAGGAGQGKETSP